MENAELMTAREAAAMLKWSPATLASKRCRGDGPVFIRLGRSIRYRPSDLAAFVEAGLRRSTGEHAEATA